ncbi:MAG TPA: ABC transporter permease [Longimicrobiales bacterium]|nr:ABC transporter permease [Longimicrobiales bacterium]
MARLVVRLLLRADEREFILGDLDELYAVWLERHGPRIAARLYWRSSLGSVLFRLTARRRSRLRNTPPRRIVMVGELLHDARSAVRTLKREPGFVATVVLTLAVGVGSTASVFAMVNQLLLRPLPGVAGGQAAGYLQFSDPGSPYKTGVSQPVFDELRSSIPTITGMASYSRGRMNARVGTERPVTALLQMVYGDFFEVLGARPAEGRLLRAQEAATTETPPPAVISEEFRARLFGADAQVAGRLLYLNDHAVQVVGVTDGQFAGPERGEVIDLWLPQGAMVPLYRRAPEWLVDPGLDRHQSVLVGLPAGASTAAIESRVEQLLDRLAAADPERAEKLKMMEARVFPGLSVPPNQRDRTHATLRVLALIVGVVFIIACANVANILLMRNVSRRGAIATRRALGASTARIARQNLLENTLLALLGTAVGLGIAWCVTLPFRHERLFGMPEFEGFTIDARVLVFAFVTAACAVMLFGTIPAALAGRFDLSGALRDGGGRETGRLTTVRSLLSAGQIALSLALLIGAILLTRTVHNLYAVETGFTIDDVWTIYLNPPSGVTGADLVAFQRGILDAVEQTPGVEAAALDFYGPHSRARFMGTIGLPETAPADRLETQAMPVTPGWLELYDVALVSGRPFAPGDWRSGSGVVLTASLAERLFGTRSAAGRRVSVRTFDEQTVEVIGVVEDLRMAHTPDESVDAFFLPLVNMPPFPFPLQFRARNSDPATVAAVQAIVERVVTDQPVAEAMPLAERVDVIHSEQRVFGRMLMLLSTMALAMAGIGLYGVVAFAVAGRRREFGIRVALGAGRSRIARLVFRYAGSIILLGTLAGLAGAYALSQILQNRLFDVAPVDPLSYTLAAALLGVVAALACWIPASRAMRVSAVDTLQGR